MAMFSSKMDKSINLTCLVEIGNQTYSWDSWQKQMLGTGSVVREGECFSAASFENISVSGTGSNS
jgi:hypothetical protein